MLTSCPVCDYPLAGLPAAHRCPECGFEYDERTRVWNRAEPWWQNAMIWIVVAATTGYILFLGNGVLGGWRFTVLDAAFAVQAGVVLLSLGFRLARGRLRSTIADGAIELLIRTGRRTWRMGWARIEGFSWDSGTLRVHIAPAWDTIFVPNVLPAESDYREFELAVVPRLPSQTQSSD